MSDKSEACPLCGTPINENEETSAVFTKKAKDVSSKTKATILIIGISIITLIMIIAFIMIRNNQKELDANQYSAEQQLLEQKQFQKEHSQQCDPQIYKEQEQNQSHTNLIEDESTLNLSSVSYEEYCNSRFGYCISYPSFFKRKSESYNQDGCEFFYGDNYSITVSGMYCYDYPITSLYNDSKKQTDTYTESKDNWFVLSGVNEQGNIYYQKTIVKNEVDYTIVLVYPKNKKDQYASILKTVINSFEIF